MSNINLKERINDYVRNLSDRIGVRELYNLHSSVVRSWFSDNISNIGRYSVKDFEKFGNLSSQEPGRNHFDRQDGWVALTEEVPDLNQFTYGTGILWIHGEMEIPPYENSPGDNIFGDEFHHVNENGSTKHIHDNAVEITYWQEASGDGDKGWSQGYIWTNTTTTFSGDNQSRWLYETITQSVGGDAVQEKNGSIPNNDNDAELYHIDNERNHYPFRIINSTSPKSINNILTTIEGTNGMYDGAAPRLAKSSWPPRAGIRYVKGGKKGILDFISPIEEN